MLSCWSCSGKDARPKLRFRWSQAKVRPTRDFRCPFFYKMVLKQCPHCDQQVPVACKACYCGYEFFQRRMYHAKVEQSSDQNNKNRRTGRVKRERPDYYSASEFETHLRRLSNKSERSGNTPPKSPKKKHRGRPRKKGSTLNKTAKTKVKGEGSSTETKDSKEEDVYSNMSAENAFVYMVGLAEINRKLQSQWNGPSAEPGRDAKKENSQYVFCEGNT
ncbi:UPF0547 protein C16orf87 homolog [Acanthaster planci]|uniref:UPF0547 protein C16orf87 homolog n=1 Tax=Acanthaster planci TaxID=133434 RepID=A0A8B7YMS9_ACAPL|nr:UPF0547 protein C16orf87 homolog [Acanthaster planci]